MSIASVTDLVKLLGDWHLLESAQVAELPVLQGRCASAEALAKELVKRGWLTPYQVNEIFLGRGANLLLGSYVLLERLGQGGMGAVFKARNWKLHRTVVLKLIRKERLAHPDAVKRFGREIRAAAQLKHRHIVHAYDADEVKGTTFLVMEFIEDAVDLDALVKKHGPLPVATSCAYMHQAALGLQHAHEHEMVHRDIKPHNLLIADCGLRNADLNKASALRNPQAGIVKILDMGLARWGSGDGNESSLTLTTESAVMGTPDYIAPEQARASHTVDIRADLYSLGATWYFLLAGRVLFPGGTLTEKLLRHQMHEPRSIARLRPDVPPELAAVIHKLLAKRPEDRFQTPGELATLLERLKRDVPLPTEPPHAETLDSLASCVDDTFVLPKAPAPPAPPTPAASGLESKPPAWPWFQRRRRLLMAAAVLLLLALAGVRYGPALYRFATNQGQLVIENETDDPDVRVIINPKKPPATIVAVKTRKDVTLTAGDYKVDLAPNLGLRLSAEGVSLGRGDTQSLRVLWQPPGPLQTLVGHKVFVWGAEFCLGGTHVISAGGSVVVDGKWTQGSDFDLRLWDVRTGEVKPLKDHTEVVVGLAVSPDGKRAVSAGGGPATDYQVRYWNLETGELIRRFDKRHTARVNALAFDADGKRVVSASLDRSVRLWDVETGKEIGRFDESGTSAPWSVDIARERILSGNRDGTLRLWDVATGKLINSFQAGHNTALHGVRFSPDGRYALAQGVKDGAMGPVLVDLDTGTIAQVFRGHTPRVFSGYTNSLGRMSFSPDGRRILSCGADRTVRLWDVAIGKELYRFEGHTAEVMSAAFSPDGRFAVSAGWDKTVRLWMLPKEGVDSTPPEPPQDPFTVQAGQTVHMLRLLESGSNPIKGKWWIEGNDLVSEASAQPRLPLQAAPTGSYEFRASFTRSKEGRRDILFFLPVGKTSCVLGFAADALGIYSGIGYIDGKGIQENKTKVELGKLKNEHRYELTVRVVLKDDQADIKVDVGPKRIVDWSGPQAALSYPLNKRPDVVVLGNNDGYVRYHQLDLRVLDGTATLLRPPPPGAVTSP